MKELKDIVLKNGVDNVYFLAKTRPIQTILGISFTSSSDPEIEMLHKIDEARYKVADGYKITLKPIHEGFSTEHYYQSDLESLIRKESIKMLVNQTIK